MVHTEIVTETTHVPDLLGVPGVQEPGFVESQGPIWSCAEHREVEARLYYAVTNERGYRVFRLVSIQSL